MREKLVSELVKEVLGPRNGIYEVLDESPLNEYITGVLAPIVDHPIIEIDSAAEIPIEDTQTYEEETGDVDVNAPPLFHPALDPKSRPSTMGLSFVVEAQKTPKINLCLTWAKYKTLGGESDNSKVKWRREPRYAILKVELDSNKILKINDKGELIKDKSAAEILLYVIVRPSEGNSFFVQLYIVNGVKKTAQQKIDVEDHIFQPQIRVSCDESTKLVSGIRKSPQREEEQKLEFLYRNRPLYARGHLCSAVWKEIDPENFEPSNFNLDFPDCRYEPPFAWLDGQLLPEEQRKLFSPPDVRTEFVPIYSIPFPQLSWPADSPRKPELSAYILADMYDPRNLHDALFPIVEEYRKWIDTMKKQISSLPKSKIAIAQSLIDQCVTVLHRIEAGINLLCSDDDVRLAFCFANKAIDTQWSWSHKAKFTWYPFQMAFILMVLESIVKPKSPYRDICDILWVPTGAGKTEAYLAIVAFTIGYRRRRALKKVDGERTGAGVSVITRYTLRLLTIQQFRRTLSVITACECLRIDGFLQKRPIGWRPSNCNIRENFLWGTTPFTAGLWVGGGVSPNRLRDTWGGNQNIPGALSILKGHPGEGEPAQVLNCPVCNTILAIPEMGLQLGSHKLHFVIQLASLKDLQLMLPKLTGKTFHGITINKMPTLSPHYSSNFGTLTMEVNTASILKAKDVDEFWDGVKKFLRANSCNVELKAARASRLGYFIRFYRGRSAVEYDFEIFCPNPECQLRQPWCAGAPMGWIHGRDPHNPAPSPNGILLPLFPDGNRLVDVQEPFLYGKSPYISDRIPIPALTVEEQVYRRLPTIVVATVDKFARPPFDPQASALFGNIEYHHCIYGYYRQHQPPCPPPYTNGHPSPAGSKRVKLYVRIFYPLENPDLIIQDELHLIEGPLGSLVGIYETAIDFLCGEGRDYSVKYIASTATIRRAEEQTKAVFLRGLQLFPPHGLAADDRFFIKDREIHALEDASPGRLYLGICAPGRGPLTPLVRIWARLLYVVWQLRNHGTTDTYWTVTGYFNAIRELAGARALYRQDIPQRLNQISSGITRQLTDEKSLELSSRTPSTDLPAILDMLNRPYPDAPDSLFTTSMFGTGVDIPRIGTMIVNGQPKTTASYIQSTGRVGRSRGALVVTFFRASRPRDLNHYELFMGYHRQIHRFVEPATVYPFSPGVLERTAGPLIVFFLRNMRGKTLDWHREDTAVLMATHRTVARETRNLPNLIGNRAQRQPPFRKPPLSSVMTIINSKLDMWQLTAHNHNNLRYVEYAINTPPQYPVVLGDYQHQHAHLKVVYENAPRSLRDIEETTGFQIR